MTSGRTRRIDLLRARALARVAVLAWLAAPTACGGAAAGTADDAASAGGDGTSASSTDGGMTAANTSSASDGDAGTTTLDDGGSSGHASASDSGGSTGDPPPLDPCVEAGNCPYDAWIARELPGFTAPDTVQTVLVDPARPSDFYAFIGSNGGPTIKVYRSTDFGDTWENRNTTAEITGNPWGASIDPNPNRDPDTPPTMWSPSGYGAVGAWKSIDGGVTWERSMAADTAFANQNPFGPALTDLYHIQILPDDPPHHVLATYHYGFKDLPDGGFGETTDGGASWVVHMPPAGIGTSHYVIPISATTWAVIAQDNGGINGIWRTTTAGRVDGEISTAAWTKVDDLEHAHGSHQNVITADGTIYATGNNNGARSLDDGATWEHFTMGSWAGEHQFEGSNMTNIAATERYLYTSYLSYPDLARAPIDAPIGAEAWDVAYCETPAEMHEGGAPFGMAVSYDPSLLAYVIVSGTYGSGMWKYIERP